MRVNRIIFYLLLALFLLGPGISCAENVADAALVPAPDYSRQFTCTVYETEPRMDENLVSVAINDENQLAVLQANYSKHILSVYDDELNWIHGKELVIFNGKLVNPVVFYRDNKLYVRFFDDAGDVNVIVDCADTNNVYTLSGVDFMDIANIALNDRPAVNISPKSKYKLHEFASKRLVFLDEDKSEIVLYDYSAQNIREIAGNKLLYVLFLLLWLTAMGFYIFKFAPRYFFNEWLYKTWSSILKDKWYK